MHILLTLLLPLCQIQIAGKGHGLACVPVQVVVEFEMIIFPVRAQQWTVIVPQDNVALKEECNDKGFPFTVDSSEKDPNTFDMGEAAGHFSYIEDPDGTLIEFVETHKIPVIKKLGWYINMRKRDPKKNLPDWLVKMLRFNRFKG